jgi:ubiquinone/menaquinone biosynthesis C-methylase UbiE
MTGLGSEIAVDERPHGMIEAASSSDQARRTYDLWSWGYDFIAGPFEQPANRIGLERAAIQPHDKVLEVAVGTGAVLLNIMKQVDPENVVSGVDLSPKMLAKTRRRLQRAGYTNVALCEADARQLPFSDNTFDVLFNSYMLDLISLADLPVVLGEFQRVLKPGGRLVLVSFSKLDPSDRTWWERIYQRMPNRWASYLMGGCRPVLMRQLVEKAGFAEVNREFRSTMFLPTEIVTAVKPAP